MNGPQAGARPLRRFGIVGDIHAEDELLAATLKHLVGLEVDAVLAVGDILDGPGSVSRCCRMLSEHSALVVRGNHDRWFFEDKLRDLQDATPAGEVDPFARTFLAALPATRRLQTVRGPLLLCHGTGEDDMAAVRPDDSGVALDSNDALQELLDAAEVRWLVGGHSHRRMVKPIGGLTIINAGTLSRRDEPGFGVVDLGEDPQVTFLGFLGGGDIVTVDVLELPCPRRPPTVPRSDTANGHGNGHGA